MRTNLEIIAPSVEEAIDKGLAELGLEEDQVDIEILDSGSKGLFGLGSRQARIRISMHVGAGREAAQPLAAAQQAKSEPALPESAVGATEEISEPLAEPAAADGPAVETSVEVVKDLLRQMKVRARVLAHMAEPEDEKSKPVVWVDLQGSDLSILIGPHAETLNALQYIASLIVSKEVGHTVPLVVDVEGFRARRIQQLRQLARRMADQAIKTGRRQVLEPMPASERRIIHIELRQVPEVTTESIGEEPRRKVTIIPK
jgi:spoIIIJ-associated protein